MVFPTLLAFARRLVLLALCCLAGAASAAAARYEAAASEAHALAPPLPPDTHATCFTLGNLPPPQICEGGSCTRGYRFPVSP